MNLAAAKNWRTVKLGDVGRVITGKTPSKDNPEDWGSVGVPFITPTDIADSSMFCKPQRYLSPAGAERFKNLIVPNRAICYTCIASVGKMCLASEPSLTNQQINSVIVDETKADHLFVFYLLRFLTPELMAIAGGTTTSIINKGQFENFEISIPESLDEQREIAGVLGCLDDKIELLRRENKTLESIAQTLFKEWFVDFRFPNATGQMVDSESGKIPGGWKVGKIKDLIDILSGFAFSSSEFSQDGKYKLVTIKNVQDRYFDSTTTDALKEIPERMPVYCKLDSGDILLSLTGNVGRICLVSGENYLLNQRVAKLKPKDAADYAFTYLLFLQKPIFALLQSTASGTAQQNLSPIQTKEIELIIPDRKTLDQFGAVANRLIQKTNENLSQIQTLSKLRDDLLNKIFR